jgi:hypothetical protein
MLQIIIDYGKLGVRVVTTLLPILRTSTIFAKEISGSGPPPITYILSPIAEAANPCLAVGMEGPEVHDSVLGLYISVLSKVFSGASPPNINSSPLVGTITAAIPPLAVGIGAFAVHVFVFGSYASLLSILDDLPFGLPPITYKALSMTPDAICCLGVGMFVLLVHVSVVGSYASFTVKGLLSSVPPTAYKYFP